MLLSEISLPLAVEDLLLVMFFAVGLLFIAKLVSAESVICGKLAFIAGILITLGGFFKVCWKLIMATTQMDVAWLNHGLFVWLSTGFILLAWALWRCKKENSSPVFWLVPVVLITISLGLAGYLAFAKETRAWFFVLLGITTLFNLFVSAQLIFRAFQKKLWFVAGLFFFNLICAFTLGGIGDQSMTLQWAKQIIGTFSQASFALGAWLLYKALVGIKNDRAS